VRKPASPRALGLRLPIRTALVQRYHVDRTLLGHGAVHGSDAEPAVRSRPGAQCVQRYRDAKCVQRFPDDAIRRALLTQFSDTVFERQQLRVPFLSDRLEASCKVREALSERLVVCVVTHSEFLRSSKPP
jgi:hypothetical protein